MNYLKYTQYIYLVAAIFLAVRAVEMWDQDNDEHFLFLGFAILCVFMFFFRRKFAKKYDDNNKKS